MPKVDKPVKKWTQVDKISKKVDKNSKKQKRISSKNFRLIIPNLHEYGQNPNADSEQIIALKKHVADRLWHHQHRRGLKQWCIAIEHHPISRLAHLDILMIYSKRIKNPPTRYDYLVKHGNLTRYRTLNRAILEYGRKQDPKPISNLNTNRILALDEASTRQGLYKLLYSAMIQSPTKFDADEYIVNNRLGQAIIKTAWQNVINRVKKDQSVVCNNILRGKRGIREITREFIEGALSAEQLELYDSWSGYGVIVEHLNQIPKYGFSRPHKTRNLLVVGRPNTGKTRLALEIERHTAVYYKDVSNWFPSYRSEVYKMVLWNQFSLKGLSYPNTLNFLEGAKMDLEYKGGSTLKTDNQLIYMNSNLTLDDHIAIKFKSAYSRIQAGKNLRARITEVVIPEHLDLFILLKLIQEDFSVKS